MVLFFFGITVYDLGFCRYFTLFRYLDCCSFNGYVYGRKNIIHPMDFFWYFFAGVVLVKGFDATVNFFGLTIIILSSITSAISYILISKIGSKDHYMVIINYFMLMTKIRGAFGCLFDWKTP